MSNDSRKFKESEFVWVDDAFYGYQGYGLVVDDYGPYKVYIGLENDTPVHDTAKLTSLALHKLSREERKDALIELL